jgi:hypothetical protein
MTRGFQRSLGVAAVSLWLALSACTSDKERAHDSAVFATGAAGTVAGGGMDSAGRPANDSMALSSGMRDSAGIRDSAALRDTARIRGETGRTRSTGKDTARKRPPRA